MAPSELRPKVNGILESALYVDDPARSAEFYGRVFGFEPVFEIDRLIAMHVPGPQLLLLFKKGASRNLPDTPHDGDGQLHLAFSIGASELDCWRSWLGENGIAIEEEKKWDRGGVSLYFRDPDGHSLEVATPGVWTIY
jgi:catechol 2,3-dioxygenase-like lactoylglutathione lyase family enzyme